MRYLATIWTIWNEEDELDREEGARYREFAQSAAGEGVLRGGEVLDPHRRRPWSESGTGSR